MFLIEFSKYQFIDGERINYIGISGSEVSFTLSGENNYMYRVEAGGENAFLNHVQSLNGNIANIQTRYQDINNPDINY